MSSIFLSHSSKDNGIAQQVKARLEQWGHRSIFLDFDPQDGIPAGRDWEKELYAKLRECRAVIVLCSHASMASKWCFAEIAHAKALGKEVFPVKIDDCKVDPILTSKQIIDAMAQWNEAYQCLEKGLLDAGLDPNGMFNWDGTRPPYPGLPAFQEQDAAIFFGRCKEIREGLALLNRLRQFGGPRLTLMLGASGSGKSSLMRAGLLPRLKRDLHWIVVDPFRPLKNPFDELARALGQSFDRAIKTKTDTGVQDLWTEIKWVKGDAKRSVDAFLELARELREQRESREATVLLIIDQCEELLTIAADKEGERFLAFLRAMLDREDSHLLVLGTLRSDFLGSFQDHPAMRGLRVETFPVPQMEVDEFTSVIEGPARIAGLELGPGLVQAMISDTQTADALPLLAFTIRELYEGFGQDKLLKLEEYRDKLGRLDGCIARVAEAVLSAKTLSEENFSDLRTAFLAMVRINDKDQYAKQPVPWNDLPASAHDVLERLASARLLISGGDGKGRTLEVAHEALFRAWPRLVVWLQTNKAFLLWQQWLRGAIRQYEEHERKHDFLLSGFPLTEALEWLKKKPDYFSPAEHQFVATSRWYKIRRRKVASAIACLALFLVGGPFAWLWKEGLTVEDAVLTAQSTFMSIHIPPEMVSIPGGTFELGDRHGRGGEAEQPVHTVTVKTFAMGKYEVTFDEYKRFTLAAKRPVPHDEHWGRGQRPVINVSWGDARGYAAWLSRQTGKRYRLPTEAEWEYAARSIAKQDDHIWAGTSDVNHLADYAVLSLSLKTEPVGTKTPNSLGLYDMSGNVWEWLEDCWHKDYNGAPVDGSAWLESNGGNYQIRVLRGGSWMNGPAEMRTSFRGYENAGNRSNYFGFRPAQDLE